MGNDPTGVSVRLAFEHCTLIGLGVDLIKEGRLGFHAKSLARQNVNIQRWRRPLPPLNGKVPFVLFVLFVVKP